MSFRRFAVFSAVAWGLTIALIQVWKYTHFGYNALDLAIYTQALWSLTHGHGFASTIQGGSYLADHFEPVLFLLAPFFRLWQSPLVLLFAQTISLSFGVYQLLRIAQRVLDGRLRIASYAVILLNPFLWNVATYEFHGLALVVPIILWAIEAYEQQRFRRWIFLLLLLTFWREDLPLLVAGWALLAIIDKRHRGWILGPIMIAALGLGVDHAIVRQAGAAHYKFLVFYQGLGSSWLELLLSPFRHPVIFATTVFHPNNWGTVAGIIGSVGGLCLLRAKWLVPLSFIGVQLLLLRADPTTLLRLHYLATIFPFVLYAAIQSLSILPEKFQAAQQRWSKVPVEFYSILSGCILVVTVVNVSPAAWSTQRAPYPTPTNSLRAALSFIQPSDSVLSSFGPLANISSRQDVYSLHYLFLGKKQYGQDVYQLPKNPDIILFDRRQWFEYLYVYRTSDIDGVSGYDRFSQLLASSPYTIIFDQDDVVVWRKKGSVTKPVYAPRSKQKISLPGIVGDATIRPQKNEPGNIEFTWHWKTLAARSKPTTFRLRWYQGTRIVSERLLVLHRSEIPTGVLSRDEQGTLRSTVAFSKKNIPDRVTIEEIQVSGEYRLQSWQTFHPVIHSIESLGSAEIRL